MSEEMKPEEQRPEEEQKPEQPGRGLYEWAQALVCSVLAAVVLFAFAVRVVGVSGGSMRNTLQNGDLLLVVNSLLCGDYQRGDVVIAAKDSFEHGEPIVKRVIATEGQQVDIDYGAGTVYVDGTALVEDYIKEQMLVPRYGEGINHVTVPEGCIFVMGDNRNNSADSRYPDIGIVDTRCVIGRGAAVLFPFTRWKGLEL